MTTLPPGTDARFPWFSVSVLGLLAIVGYGTWYYSFSVLLEPILTDTGWSEGWLVGSFGATGLIGAIGAPLAGRAFDANRARFALAGAGIVAAGCFGAASFTGSFGLFMTLTVVGGSALAAFAYYHATQTLAVRAVPAMAAKAVGVITLYGAFTSTIYLPLTALLVETNGWRMAMRVLAVVAGVALLAAAAALPDSGGAPPIESSQRGMGILGTASGRRYALATFGIGATIGVILVYQVSIMTAAGLSLTTAAWLAGARGTLQFVGRLPVVWLAERVGSARSLRMAFASIGVGCGFLAFSTDPIIGLAYVLFAGVGIGATAPLLGIRNTAIFPRHQLGQGMGTMTLIFGTAMAVSPTAIAAAGSVVPVRWLAPGVAVTGAVIAVGAMSEGDVPG